MNRRWIWIILLFSVALLNGCMVYPIYNTAESGFTGIIYSDFRGPLSASLYEPKKFEVVGRTRGESKAISIMNLIAFGNGGFTDAYQDALARSSGDALIDIQSDQRMISFLFLFQSVTFTVRGTAVKSLE